MGKQELYEELVKLDKELVEYGSRYTAPGAPIELTAYAKIKRQRRKITFKYDYRDDLAGREGFVFTTTARSLPLEKVPSKAMRTMIKKSHNKLARIEGEIDEVIAMYSTDVAEMVFEGETTGKMGILRELARRKIIELGNMFPFRPHLHIVCDYIRVDLEEYEFDIELELDGTGVTVTVDRFPTETETLDYQAFVQMLKHLDTIKEKLEEIKNEFAQLGK